MAGAGSTPFDEGEIRPRNDAGGVNELECGKNVS